MSSDHPKDFRLGPWNIEPLRGAITDPDGKEHHLEPKVMDVFVCLAERANELVTREELLEAVWGEHAVSDEPLTRAIGELRRAFQNDHGDSISIETVPKRGYRLIGEVLLTEVPVAQVANTIQFPGSHKVVPADEDVALHDAQTVSADKNMRLRRIGFAVIGALSLVLIIFMADRIRPGEPSLQTTTSNQPVVTAYKKLTQSQIIPLPVSSPSPILADDTRLFFPVYEDGRFGVRQVAQTGGEVIEFHTPFNHSDSIAVPSSMTTDRSTIIFDVYDDLKSGDLTVEEWTLPVVGGSPMHLGEGMNGILDPSGEKMLFTKDHLKLYLANADMTAEREIASPTGMTTYWPRFSPDGTRVRFTVLADHNAGRLWELRLDGSDPVPLLEDWPARSVCCGTWTPDGDYYVFEARHEAGTQLWAVKNLKNGSVSSAKPFPVTSGIIDFSRPTVSADGKKIFAFGAQLRGEIVAYDFESNAFRPMPGLESMSIEDLAYSPDKQSVTYVSYPNPNLWRKNLDGTRAIQLTFSSMRIASPSWSPDGSTIVFNAWEPGEIRRIYTVPSDGGEITLISDADVHSWSPTWSPDGSNLAFSQAGSERLKIHDLTFGTTSELPGSDGMHSPFWSPDGRFIATGMKGDFLLYDVAKQTSELMIENDGFGAGYWSEDSKSVFLVDRMMAMRERSVYRLNIETKSLVKIAQVGHERNTWGAKNRWVGVTPDGTPMLLRDHSIHNIYALEWNRN